MKNSQRNSWPLEPHISWRGENSEFESPSAPVIVFFLARPTKIDGHRNSIALPSLTQFFSPSKR